jgi:hypothetical protein
MGKKRGGKKKTQAKGTGSAGTREEEKLGDAATLRTTPARAAYTCDVCGKADAKNNCPACKTPYCDKECQLKGWPKHKKACKKIVATRKAAEAELEAAVARGQAAAQRKRRAEVQLAEAHEQQRRLEAARLAEAREQQMRLEEAEAAVADAKPVPTEGAGERGRREHELVEAVGGGSSGRVPGGEGGGETCVSRYFSEEEEEEEEEESEGGEAEAGDAAEQMQKPRRKVKVNRAARQLSVLSAAGGSGGSAPARGDSDSDDADDMPHLTGPPPKDGTGRAEAEDADNPHADDNANADPNADDAEMRRTVERGTTNTTSTTSTEPNNNAQLGPDLRQALAVDGASDVTEEKDDASTEDGGPKHSVPMPSADLGGSGGAAQGGARPIKTLPQATLDAPWSCPACTYFNLSGSVCEVCGGAQPDLAAPDATPVSTDATVADDDTLGGGDAPAAAAAVDEIASQIDGGDAMGAESKAADETAASSEVGEKGDEGLEEECIFPGEVCLDLVHATGSGAISAVHQSNPYLASVSDDTMPPVCPTLASAYEYGHRHGNDLYSFGSADELERSTESFRNALSSGHSVGIDLGNVCSRVGVWQSLNHERHKTEGGHNAIVIPNELGESSTGSFVLESGEVMINGDGELRRAAPVVGREALFGFGSPYNSVHFRRLKKAMKPIGGITYPGPGSTRYHANMNSPDENVQTTIGTQPLAASNVATVGTIVGKMKQLAESYLGFGERVTSAVLTIPPSTWSICEFDYMRAGRMAGLHISAILPEPVAAAYAHNIHTKKPGTRVLVFELGSSTMSLNTVTVQKGGSLSDSDDDGVRIHLEDTDREDIGYYLRMSDPDGMLGGVSAFVKPLYLAVKAGVEEAVAQFIVDPGDHGPDRSAYGGQKAAMWMNHVVFDRLRFACERLAIDILACDDQDEVHTLDLFWVLEPVVGRKSDMARHDENGSGCAVCHGANRTVSLRPCGHLCVCSSCAKSYFVAGNAECPLCNAPTSGHGTVFPDCVRSRINQWIEANRWVDSYRWSMG